MAAKKKARKAPDRTRRKIYTLRLTAEEYSRYRNAAEKEDRSMQSWIVRALERQVEAERGGA